MSVVEGVPVALEDDESLGEGESLAAVGEALDPLEIVEVGVVVTDARMLPEAVGVFEGDAVGVADVVAVRVAEGVDEGVCD